MRFRRLICIASSFLLVLTACGEKENTGTSGSGGSGGTTPKTYTISGTVKGSDGNLLGGVVVSDGINCVKTDSKGKFYLDSDLASTDLVFVSTPSGYSAPVKDGHANFWKFLKDVPKGTDGKYVVDFTLNKIANPERYTVFIFADPQPRKKSANYDNIAYHSLDCCNDMYRDMKELAATMKDRPVYGIGLGDIVHRELSLLDAYKTGMTTTGITNYNVIGNHDHDVSKPDDYTAGKAFEAKMGPLNYSFNLGGMHYLMLDNMISPDESTGIARDECATGFTADIWQFIQNDLAHVPTTTPLMVCAHSPMVRGQNGNMRSGPYLSDFRALLSKYPKAYVWAGHSHSTYNYVDKANPVIETHTLSRVTGALWTNEYLGANGTPRGYTVFEYDNGDISWKFKPIFYQSGAFTGTYGGGTGTPPDYVYRDWNYVDGRAVMKSGSKPLDGSYQMQVFTPGTYPAPYNEYLYVNVFLWDELWSAPRFTMDGDVYVMKRVTDTKYSMSDWSITSFYHNYKNISGDFNPDDHLNNVDSMFRVYLDGVEHGHGKVSVVDRFGNEHSMTVSW